MRSVVVAVVVAVALTAAGCSSTTPTTAVSATPTATHAAPAVTPTPTPAAPKPTPAPAEPKADASAELACGHYSDIMANVAFGNLTDMAELRTKIQEVSDMASGSENAGIADGARVMLAAITADDSDGFVAAGTAFSAACSAAGV